MNCRLCGTVLGDVFLDLGSAPPSNAFLTAETLLAPEAWYPLKLFTCHQCLLVQVGEIRSHTALFDDDYVYFSSFSASWLAHAERYVQEAVKRLLLDDTSLVMEVASNDGYLLQYVASRNIPCVGIEPTASTANAARARGIETIGRFFGSVFAREYADAKQPADLIIANNVIAHVPDVNDFVEGFRVALAATGTVTIEFPHLMELVTNRQFDTVYHEHFSYLSLHAVLRLFDMHGLEIWDVQRLPTHGGSLRVWASHTGVREPLPSVEQILEDERQAGMLELSYYQRFQYAADKVKNDFIAFLLECRRKGLRVAGYGAAAKGNTLINYAGVRPDLLRYVVDASPHKQGRWLPGSRIPVVPEQVLRDDRPDIVVILPWNLRDEITNQLAYIREWGGQFAVAVPSLEVS
ncbi:methyltransferase C-terminal domain-containing protein [Rothia nasimurium]|uniref:Class I SAM-dependent methyltransferase n=1 Tax=Luteibacter anthropi TaxID=564369 RepID=A0A7X5UEV5_9GAMM|nr:class I SAM-dependent methyltransferase [Luteibacter anthropi]NII08972.1 class I SAM-dependent methyltransferase [Luteibacter anthropi]